MIYYMKTNIFFCVFMRKIINTSNNQAFQAFERVPENDSMFGSFDQDVQDIYAKKRSSFPLTSNLVSTKLCTSNLLQEESRQTHPGN